MSLALRTDEINGQAAVSNAESKLRRREWRQLRVGKGWETTRFDAAAAKSKQGGVRQGVGKRERTKRKIRTKRNENNVATHAIGHRRLSWI